MTQLTSNNSTLLHSLGRWALILSCCTLMIAEVGAAANTGPAMAEAAARPHPAIRVAQPPAGSKQLSGPAVVELMHDAAPVKLQTAVEPVAAAAMLPAGESSLGGSHARIIYMEVTAYCGCKKCCGPGAHGLTASGRSVAYNGGLFVAADTRLFPFGTQLQIPGYAAGSPVEVIDRGSAIKGNHIDLFFPTHEQARAWGRQRLAVTVVEDN